jgi:hypothetical protein
MKATPQPIKSTVFVALFFTLFITLTLAIKIEKDESSSINS